MPIMACPHYTYQGLGPLEPDLLDVGKPLPPERTAGQNFPFHSFVGKGDTKAQKEHRTGKRASTRERKRGNDGVLFTAEDGCWLLLAFEIKIFCLRLRFPNPGANTKPKPIQTLFPK